MTPRNYEAGSHIESVCGKCKEKTNHLVIAMVGDEVAKVQCNICGSMHKHRPPVAARAASSGAPKKSRAAGAPSRVSASVRKYQDAVAEAAGGRKLSYSIESGYREGDLLQHPTFGLGVVQKLTRPNKMDVLFEDGVKLLRCKLG